MCDQLRLTWGCTTLLLTLVFGGCAARGGYDDRLPLNSSFQVYQLYDNSRDWGPSYLVEAPDHEFGNGGRIDDSRSAPPQAAATPLIPTYDLPPFP